MSETKRQLDLREKWDYRWGKSAHRTLDRWCLESGASHDASARVVIGDSDGSGLLSVWGHNSLGPTVWSFGEGDGVHTHRSARDIGALTIEVLWRRVLRQRLDWSPAESQGPGEVWVSTHEEMVMRVISAPMVITGGRRFMIKLGEIKDDQEIVKAWRWRVEIPKSGGGRVWNMDSSNAILDRGVAMSYAERLAVAFTEAGFGSELIRRNLEQRAE